MPWGNHTAGSLKSGSTEAADARVTSGSSSMFRGWTRGWSGRGKRGATNSYNASWVNSTGDSGWPDQFSPAG